jgi:uncharacterized membrane protein YeaQ/YmgE (transglycosylase-associated protein family)
MPGNGREEDTMNMLIWLILGGVIGWLASIVMKTGAQQGVMLNIVVGVAGAAFGGWLMSPLTGAGSIGQGDFNPFALLVALIGAVVLLILVNLVRKATAR